MTSTHETRINNIHMPSSMHTSYVSETALPTGIPDWGTRVAPWPETVGALLNIDVQGFGHDAQAPWTTAHTGMGMAKLHLPDADLIVVGLGTKTSS